MRSLAPAGLLADAPPTQSKDTAPPGRRRSVAAPRWQSPLQSWWQHQLWRRRQQRRLLNREAPERRPLQHATAESSTACHCRCYDCRHNSAGTSPAVPLALRVCSPAFRGGVQGLGTRLRLLQRWMKRAGSPGKAPQPSWPGGTRLRRRCRQDMQVAGGKVGGGCCQRTTSS